MKIALNRADFNSYEDFVYALANHYFDYLEQYGEQAMENLNDEQNTFLAYIYLDMNMQDGGFLQLIASGYGEYIFMNPLADSLRRWKIKPTPKILEKAKALYIEHGAQIEALAENEEDLNQIRAQFDIFEELDGDYYDCCDEDMMVVADYIEANWQKFVELPDAV